MSKVFTLLTISTVLLSPVLVAAPADKKSEYAQNFNPSSNPSSNQGLGGNQNASQNVNWLGVSLGVVPDVLRGQLGHLIPDGQGVLVMGVSPSSSAFKAGIGRNDVLLSYDDQKLYSPRQLSGLIRSDIAGREVRLQVVQKGVLKTLGVKLGSKQTQQRQNPDFRHWPYPPQGYSPFGMMPPQTFNHFSKPDVTGPYTLRPDNNNNKQQSLSWDSFESVKVNTLPDGRYHAEISYKNKANETKKFSFEGKREEIIEQINAQAELPTDKKKALLDALNMRSGSFMGGSLQGNPFMNQPFFQRNPFNDPFFQRNPFNDPFFKRGFQFDPFDVSPRYQQKVPPVQMKGIPEEVI